MSEIHNKPAFDRADPEKKQRVLEAGISEFANHGYERANINVIAKKAKISIGLMYKYFDTKEDLFITCMNEAIDILDSEIRKIVTNPEDKILVRAEKLLRVVQKTSREDATFIKIYQGVTELNSSQHAEYFAHRIEDISFKAYSAFLNEAQKSGDIRSDCDVRVFAFLFDSILMMYQFSYVSDYFKERFKIYCGDDIFDDDEKVVQETLKFLESAFTFEHEDIKRLEAASSEK